MQPESRNRGLKKANRNRKGLRNILQVSFRITQNKTKLNRFTKKQEIKLKVDTEIKRVDLRKHNRNGKRMLQEILRD